MTATLPLAMLAGLTDRPRAAMSRRGARLDVAAQVAVLQLCAVLAAWGLLPLRLWA